MLGFLRIWFRVDNSNSFRLFARSCIRTRSSRQALWKFLQRRRFSLVLARFLFGAGPVPNSRRSLREKWPFSYDNSAVLAESHLIAGDGVQVFDDVNIDIQITSNTIPETRLVGRCQLILHAGVWKTLGEALVSELTDGSLHLQSASLALYKAPHLGLFLGRKSVHDVPMYLIATKDFCFYESSQLRPISNQVILCHAIVVWTRSVG